MATTKKRAGEASGSGEKSGARKSPRAAKAGTSPRASPRKTSSEGRPRLRASHSSAKVTRAKKAVAPPPRRRPIAPPAEKAAAGPPSGRKTPLAAPKRTTKREQLPEPSSQAREMAVSIAIAGLDKKALGIEILDVTGKVDYADFLVVMTGRSDRHVHAIATGIEEALSRKNKIKPMSVEGLSTATWVLLDFGEVVVHVFQEDSRKLYDIEGLWIDAGRVPLPETEQKAAAQIDDNDGLSS